MFFGTWFEMLWFGSVLVPTWSHRKAFTQKITSQMSVDDCATVLRFKTEKRSTNGSAGREPLHAGRCSSCFPPFVSWSNFGRLGSPKKVKLNKNSSRRHFMSVCICVDLLWENQKNRKIHHWFWQRRWAKRLSEHHRSKNDAAACEYWSAGRETHLSASVVRVGVFQVMLLRKLRDRRGAKRWKVQCNSSGFNSCFLFWYETQPPTHSCFECKTKENDFLIERVQQGKRRGQGLIIINNN